MRLGRTPHENFLEIIRKVPRLFGAQGDGREAVRLYEATLSEAGGAAGFDEAIRTAINRLGHSLFSYGNLATLDDQALLAHTPQFLGSLYQSFLRAMTSEDGGPSADWQQKTLLYLCRALYHQKFSLVATRVELFLIFIGLLSEHFELDAAALALALKKEYLALGGQSRQSRVHTLKKEPRAPWCLELSTFEGWILPHKIFLFGGDLRGYPLQIQTTGDQVAGVEFKWKLRYDLKCSLVGEQIISSKLARMGTDFPLWFGTFNEREISICTFMGRSPGSKLDFVKESLRQALLEDLRPLVGDIALSIEEEEVRELAEVWRGPVHGRASAPGVGRPQVLMRQGPGVGKGSKGITYFGPIGEAGPGLLSTLMDMRDPRPYLS